MSDHFFISSGFGDALCERFDADRKDISFDLDAGDDGKVSVLVTVTRRYGFAEPPEEVHYPFDSLTEFAEYLEVSVD